MRKVNCMNEYYIVKSTLIYLPAIRDMTLSEAEAKIYFSFKYGDSRTMPIYFKSAIEAKAAFNDICTKLLSLSKGCD